MEKYSYISPANELKEIETEVTETEVEVDFIKFLNEELFSKIILEIKGNTLYTKIDPFKSKKELLPLFQNSFSIASDMFFTDSTFVGTEVIKREGLRISLKNELCTKYAFPANSVDFFLYNDVKEELVDTLAYLTFLKVQEAAKKGKTYFDLHMYSFWGLSGAVEQIFKDKGYKVNAYLESDFKPYITVKFSW